MRSKKRRVESFLFYQYTDIERHLTRMAERGWQLEAITSFGWRYRRAEPKRLTYSVTYFADASEFDPEPTEDQQVYLDYCAQAGWRFVAQWAQMQIFCSEEEHPVPIETDEQEKFRAICRSMKKNYLPGNLLLLGCCLLQMFTQSQLFFDNPIMSLATSTTLTNFAVWLLLAIHLGGSLFLYWRWKRRTAAAVAQGGPCTASTSKWPQWSGRVAVILLVLSQAQYFFLQNNGRTGWVYLIYGLFFMLAILLPVLGVKQLCKKLKADRITNVVFTTLAAIVVSILATMVLAKVVFWSIDHGVLEESQPETVTVTTDRGQTYMVDVYHDDLPLTIEDLQDEGFDQYSYARDHQESIFLRREAGLQTPYLYPGDAPELYYARLTPKLPLVYRFCRWELTRPFASIGVDYEMTPMDPAPWRAEAAYQKRALNPYHDDLFEGYYVLCYENMLLSLRTDLPLTEEQIAVIVDRLVQ